MPWVSFETQGIQLVRKGLERLRRKVPLVSRQRIYDAMVKIRRIMKEPGLPPTYPIHWDSTRQRKAFFATDGFGRGIPTRRTGAYQRAWQIIKTDNGYDVGNPLSHSIYLAGTARSGRRQSRIHRGRWPLFVNAINKVIGKLPRAVREGLKQTARQIGFRVED